jgi:hypothetical protein
MYLFQKNDVASYLFMLTLAICAPSQAKQQQPAEKRLHAGFALAQTCEHEIDDDMSSYGECIGHAMDRVSKQRHVLLGLHFQAWLMADLAARQNSLRSFELRQQHAHGVKKQLRATGVTLDQLCQAKQIACESIRVRMAQKLQ